MPFERDENLPEFNVGFADRGGNLLPEVAQRKERLRKMREDEERGIDVTSKAYQERNGWFVGEVTRS